MFVALFTIVFTLAFAAGIPLTVYFVRRRLDFSTRLRTFGPGWEAVLRDLDPNARIASQGGRLIAEFQHEGLAFVLTFHDYADVSVRLPPGMQVTVPNDGKTRELAQRIRWDKGVPTVRLGCEKSDMLLPTCTALAPLVRNALAQAARVDVPAPR